MISVDPNDQAYQHAENVLQEANNGEVDLSNSLMFKVALTKLNGPLDFGFAEDTQTVKLNFQRKYIIGSTRKLLTATDFITSEDLKDVFSFLQKIPMSHLDLTRAEVDDEIGCHLLALVKNSKSIKKVTLSNNPKLSQSLYEEIMENVNSVENMLATFNMMTVSRSLKIRECTAKLSKHLKEGYQSHHLKEYSFQNVDNSQDPLSQLTVLRKNICYLPSELQAKIIGYTSPFSFNAEDISNPEQNFDKERETAKQII